MHGLGVLIFHIVENLQFLCIHGSASKDSINWGWCRTVVFTLEKNPCINPWTLAVQTHVVQGSIVYISLLLFYFIFLSSTLTNTPGHKRQCGFHLALPFSLGTCLWKGATMLWGSPPMASVRFPAGNQCQSSDMWLQAPLNDSNPQPSSTSAIWSPWYHGAENSHPVFGLNS